MSALRLCLVALCGIGLVEAMRPDSRGNGTFQQDPDLVSEAAEHVDSAISRIGQIYRDLVHFHGLSPTLAISILTVVSIMVVFLFNQATRTLCCTHGLVRGAAKDWLWPVGVTCGLALHCAWLYNVVLAGQTKEHAVAILMVMAVSWWAMTFLYEVYVKTTPLCRNKEAFVAGDVYSDLTDTMFNVAVRFMMQASMMIILVYVSREMVQAGSPENISDERKMINFAMALTLTMYLFVSSRDHTTWEDLRRLRKVRAVRQFGHADEEGDKSSVFGDLIQVAPGDFYVRFAMSVVITGVFQKFLVLAYPLLVFTSFAQESWVTLLKDILAITIVVQLDNLGRPVSFEALLHSDDADDG